MTSPAPRHCSPALRTAPLSLLTKATMRIVFARISGLKAPFLTFQTAPTGRRSSVGRRPSTASATRSNGSSISSSSSDASLPVTTSSAPPSSLSSNSRPCESGCEIDLRSSRMPTECNPELFEFAPVEGRRVVAAFDGGDDHLGCRCVAAGRDGPGDPARPSGSRRASPTRGWRNWWSTRSARWSAAGVGIALGYEDLNDHDELRHDPVLAVLAGKLAAQRSDCAPLAGKSTLNRLELSRPSRRAITR